MTSGESDTFRFLLAILVTVCQAVSLVFMKFNMDGWSELREFCIMSGLLNAAKNWEF